jgi:hypothetical protein
MTASQKNVGGVLGVEKTQGGAAAELRILNHSDRGGGYDLAHLESFCVVPDDCAMDTIVDQTPVGKDAGYLEHHTLSQIAAERARSCCSFLHKRPIGLRIRRWMWEYPTSLPKCFILLAMSQSLFMLLVPLCEFPATGEEPVAIAGSILDDAIAVFDSLGKREPVDLDLPLTREKNVCKSRKCFVHCSLLML